ncbi:hypothetical protein ID866_5704 [Astraeus odoratus]|nr:hypothetical protein ID866_5704 [Astraeus odoratus]
MISAHLFRRHDDTISSILGQADRTTVRGRRRKHLATADENDDSPELRDLEDHLDSISLRCWEFGKESMLFMRTSKNSDFNVLQSVKKTGCGTLIRRSWQSSVTGSSPSSGPEGYVAPEAMITMSIYSRVPWVQSYLTRMSQHTVLGSQTLSDLIQSIPCDSSEMPTEMVNGEDAEDGCLLLMEGIVYGDGRPGLPEDKRPAITKSSASLGQTTFDSLTLRINQPYWMLHQGDCEHFIVIEQIRLPHPSDPPSGYPLIVHLTPTLSDLCRACSKVPAVISIAGDIRLGESPCLLCTPCWRSMGPPKNGEDIMVVPLARHQHIWASEEDYIMS